MRALLRLFVVAVVFFPLTGYATDVSGYQWGTWTRENSPYNVVGQIRVPPESTLVIEPGVVVNFRGHYRFKVDSSATLLAVGTETDSIYFTTDDTATGWHGIRFIYADSSSHISFCRLEYGKAIGNWPHPDAGGGAIYCGYSSPIISDNTIINNWAEVAGGGIYCYHSSPEISNNTIGDNWAAHGGGISCRYDSNPTISGNSISGNSAGGYGGGIYCRSSSAPLIIANMISGNSAGTGGGIYCWYWSHPPIINNTISGNSASGWGGGIFCHRSSPTITNTILWGDTAPNSPEIYVGNTNTIVIYCDVQGGWEGLGNIDADPLFVGAETADFHLRWRSPCIDSGDPSLTDPDGTRSDIGAFYFNQDVDGIVELYPRNTPIVIPPEGGEVVYDGWVFNFLGQPGRADIWTYAFVPEVGQYGPINLRENIYVPADSFGIDDITQHVPGDAPGGDYVFVAYVGDYPNTIIDSSYFYFTKSGSVSCEMAGWFEGDEWQKESDLAESNLPSAYALSQNYPNPFNATTTIQYQLAEDGQVVLDVCNLFGQKVATLVDGRQGAGYKSVSWDASSVSSGLYFYRLSAGDYTETRRMMVVK